MSADKFSKQPIRQPRSGRSVVKHPPKANNTRLIWLLLSLTGVAMLSATAGALLALSLSTTPLMQTQLTPAEEAVFSKDDKISSNSSFRLPELTRPVNILVLGIKVLSSDLDNPPPELKNLGYHAVVNSFDGLSDTMLMLRFDPVSKKTSILSIPRDTRTYIEGHGIGKINDANAYGGPALSAKAVSELLGGVGIDRYVRINVLGVEKLIDALGGVTVHVPKDIKYQDDSQHLYINLKAGKQHLNGDQTMKLLRFRYDEFGDIGRIQRQQMVMRSLMEQTLNPATVARLPKILSIVQSHLDTNLSVEELVALMGFSSQLNRSNVEMLMVPGDFSRPGDFPLSYWIPDQGRIQEMVSQHFDVGTAPTDALNPAYLRVAVQDSTGQPQAVDGLMDKLYDAGYSNIYLDRDWSEPLKVTRIVAQRGDVASAEALRRQLGFGEVRIESTGNLSSDLTIKVGQDWLRRKTTSQ